MAVLIDPPRWPAHGRVWSHLVSDTSLDELHAMARAVGIPRRAFEGDHYDVPAERYADLVAAGAREVEGRVLLSRLVASGLRVPKRRGERVLSSESADDSTGYGHRVLVDVVASRLPLPPAADVGARALVTGAGDRLLLVRADTKADLPIAHHPALADRVRLSAVGYLRIRPVVGADGESGVAAGSSTWSYQRLLAGSVGEHVVGDHVVVDDSTHDGQRTGWVDSPEALELLAATRLVPLVQHVLDRGMARPGQVGGRR